MDCPKCGSNFISQNEDGDLECICGKIIYATLSRESKPLQIHQKVASKSHYTAVIEKKPLVIKAVEKGIGVRQASREFGLAVNTVKSIIREDDKASQAQKVRRNREKELHWLKFALRGLAVHAERYTPSEMCIRAIALLEKYMKGNPKRTVCELIPEIKDGISFTTDDIVRETMEILTRETLNYLSDTFEHVGEDIYRLKNK